MRKLILTILMILMITAAFAEKNIKYSISSYTRNGQLVYETAPEVWCTVPDNARLDDKGFINLIENEFGLRVTSASGYKLIGEYNVGFCIYEVEFEFDNNKGWFKEAMEKIENGNR